MIGFPAQNLRDSANTSIVTVKMSLRDSLPASDLPSNSGPGPPGSMRVRTASYSVSQWSESRGQLLRADIANSYTLGYHLESQNNTWTELPIGTGVRAALVETNMKYEAL